MMMNIETQMAIAEQKNETGLAEYLRQIIAESQREDRVNMAKKFEADNLIFVDEDF